MDRIYAGSRKPIRYNLFSEIKNTKFKLIYSSVLNKVFYTRQGFKNAKLRTLISKEVWVLTFFACQNKLSCLNFNQKCCPQGLRQLGRLYKRYSFCPNFTNFSNCMHLYYWSMSTRIRIRNSRNWNSFIFVAVDKHNICSVSILGLKISLNAN